MHIFKILPVKRVRLTQPSNEQWSVKSVYAIVLSCTILNVSFKLSQKIMQTNVLCGWFLPQEGL